MSRMLQALKQIEAKQPRIQSPLKKPPQEDRPSVRAKTRSLATIETRMPNAANDLDNAVLMELHPVIQEELNNLRMGRRITSGFVAFRSAKAATFAERKATIIDRPILSQELLIEQPFIHPPVTRFATTDPYIVDNTLAQAELAVDSALRTEHTGVYEGIAQYILTQLTPGQSAAFLFTSLEACAEKTEILIAVSKILTDRFQRKAYVLDALHNTEAMQDSASSFNSLGWAYSLAQLKTQYQLVLIDAPSLADARTASMISQCNGVYLAIRLGYATPYDLKEAIRVIKQAGGRLLGGIAID